MIGIDVLTDKFPRLSGFIQMAIASFYTCKIWLAVSVNSGKS